MTTFGFPTGSFVYFIFALIDLFAFSPIACTKDANYIFTIRKAHREDAFTKTAKAIVSILGRAMRSVFCDNATRVCEGELCFREGHTVLFLVFPVLLRIPFEPRLGHSQRLA